MTFGLEVVRGAWLFFVVEMIVEEIVSSLVNVLTVVVRTAFKVVPEENDSSISESGVSLSGLRVVVIFFVVVAVGFFVITAIFSVVRTEVNCGVLFSAVLSGCEIVSPLSNDELGLTVNRTSVWKGCCNLVFSTSALLTVVDGGFSRIHVEIPPVVVG